MIMTTEPDPQTPASQTQVALPPIDAPIVATAGRYYRNMRYLMVVAMLGFGCYFLYDGYIGWPKENARAAAEGTKLPHDEFQIQFQKVIGYTLLPAAVVLLGTFLYRSRGSCRLAGETLSIPGHPSIPLDAIRKIDKRLWKRKGIAYIDYQPSGSTRLVRFKLDDFIYDQKPIDRIFECIEAYAPAETEIVQ